MFYAGRNFKWKFSLSVYVVLGLHENLICFISWIQGQYIFINSPKPEASIGLPVLIARCLYPAARCMLRIQNRGMEDVLEFLMIGSQRCACWGWWLGELVGRSEFSLANVFKCLRHMAPHKPSAILLASCTGVWVRLHVFWKPISLLRTSWFLRWLLQSELPASWQCLEKEAESVLDRWPPWLFIFDSFFFRSASSGDVTDVGAEIGPHSHPRYRLVVLFQSTYSYEFCFHECLWPIYVCYVLISSHFTNEVRIEIISMASEM